MESPERVKLCNPPAHESMADAPDLSGHARAVGLELVTPRIDSVRRLEAMTAEAVEFLGMFFAEQRGAGQDRDARVAEVVAEIAATGTYRHTPAELAFGCRLAWRQSSRCVGRARWRNLLVRDRRDVDTVDGITVELVGHVNAAMGRAGAIRNVITVFGPDDPATGPRARIWNSQLFRYAGYRAPGRVGGG